MTLLVGICISLAYVFTSHFYQIAVSTPSQLSPPNSTHPVSVFPGFQLSSATYSYQPSHCMFECIVEREWHRKWAGDHQLIRAMSFKFKTPPYCNAIAWKDGFRYEFMALKNHLDFIMPRITFDRITICTSCQPLFKSLHTGVSKYSMNQEITDYILNLVEPFSGDVAGGQWGMYPLIEGAGEGGDKNKFEKWKPDQLVQLVSSFNSRSIRTSKYARNSEREKTELMELLRNETKLLMKTK